MLKSTNRLIGPFVLAFLSFSLISNQAHAIDNFNPGNLSGLTTDTVDELLKVSALGTAHRSLQPASSLGMTVGLDVGVEVDAIVVPDEFKNSLSLATQKSVTEIPEVIPVPRLSVHKGFPAGIDLGFSYLKYQDVLSVWGVDAKWMFFGGGVKPSLAARASYGHSKLYFIQTHVVALDVMASKSLLVIEPYIGTGLQTWGGALDVPLGGSTGLPLNISASQSGTTGHIFGGLPLKLLILHITAEIDHTFAGVTTYGSKVSISF